MARTARTTRTTNLPREPRTTQAARTKKALPARKRTLKGLDTSGPPVMVRGMPASTPMTPRKRSKKIRHRYDVALGVPGAEIRLPALPEVHVGWRFVSLLLVAALAAALYYVWNSPLFRVQAAQISGNTTIPASQVSDVADVADTPIFLLSQDGIRQDLEKAFPEFASVAVQVSLPDTVMITVTERVAVLTWHQGDHIELVDADGVAFTARDSSQTGPAPHVMASDPPPQLASDLLEAGSVESQVLASKKELLEDPTARPFLSKEMVAAILFLDTYVPRDASMQYSLLHGFGWKDPRGWEVYFGDSRDIEMKMRVYKAILKKLKAEDISPNLISVESVHAPYYHVERNSDG